MSEPTYTVVMTKSQAKALGILRCESCGHPENNHHDFNNKPCAHCDKDTCKGFVPQIRLPLLPR